MVEKKMRKSTRKAGPGRGSATAAEPLRGHIPEISEAQAQALRGLFMQPHTWSPGEGTQLSITPGNGAGGEAFCVEADGTPMQLRIDAAGSASDLHWSDYSGRARMLAWSLANESALRRLSNVLGASLLPVEAAGEDGRDGDDDDAPLWLDFHGDDEAGAALLRGSLRLPVGWIDRLIAHAEPVYDDDPLPHPGRWLTVPAPLSIRCAGPTLEAAQWNALSPGDVVIVSRGRAPEFEARSTGRAWPLTAGERGWQVTGTARTLSSQQDSSRMNEATSSDDTAAEQTEAPDAPETEAKAERHPAHDLPVQLAFEIGTLELNVGELAALQPGYVFDLPTQLEGRNVVVRANGRVAGHGELVAVGDTLGVRLLSWS